MENRSSEDVNRGGSRKGDGGGGGCGECISPLAIFKHVFDKYKFFIISNFFEVFCLIDSSTQCRSQEGIGAMPHPPPLNFPHT